MSARLESAFCLGRRTRGVLAPRVGVVLLVLSAAACNPLRFFECKDEMAASQEVLLQMDDQEPADVERALHAVNRAVGACEGVAPDAEFSKMKDAAQKLEKQLSGLRGRKPPERPLKSEAELALLASQGDPDCPRGQKYEHPQNKQMIQCKGPQLVEMTPADVRRHFVQNRNFREIRKGAHLRVERGAEVFEFVHEAPESSSPPRCVTVVGLRGISWQELVARATGVQPRRLKLGKPVPTSRGALPLLVEGDDQQFTVKLGQCEATAGQKAYTAPAQ